MRIELGACQVWSHPDHTIVAGRVHKAEIVLGDVFTLLAWTPWLQAPVNDSRVGEPTAKHEVALRVEGIEAYQHSLDLLPTGMTGGLKLVGMGQELLRAVDPEARIGQWLLLGE
jgi:hypothetical protein